jgi:hypothetical protein
MTTQLSLTNMESLLGRTLALGFDSAELNELIACVVGDSEAARALRPRVLLHLPRLADETGRLPVIEAEAEVRRLAAEEAPTPSWMQAPAEPPEHATDLRLGNLEEARARTVLERLHYLRSHRPGSLYLAGFAADRVAALLTFSALDLGRIASTLPHSLDAEEVLVLSRVYAAGWAPRNSLSRLLAQAGRRLREHTHELKLLLTYLNPNVGFDGASYKAANWTLYGRERQTRYAYLDASYATDRELTRRFGTSNAGELRRSLGRRVAFSRMPLTPLKIYGFALEPTLRETLERRRPCEWSRPWA